MLTRVMRPPMLMLVLSVVWARVMLKDANSVRSDTGGRGDNFGDHLKMRARIAITLTVLLMQY